QVPSPSAMRFLTHSGAGNTPGVMISTDDGGATFQQRALPAPFLSTGQFPSATDVQFWDNSNGILLMGNGCCNPMLYVTSDAGQTWVPTAAQPLRFIYDRYGNLIDTYYRVVDAIDPTHFRPAGG